MIQEFLLVGVGLVLLLVAGDLLVKGAVNLSLRLGVPALIVSLTIVAFGTSAPELLVSVQAVLRGAPGLALGNVVGSNTANILLVLGLPALFRSLGGASRDTRKSYLQMLFVSAVFIVLCFLGPLTIWHGLVLLLGLALMLWDHMRDARAHMRDREYDTDLEGADPAIKGWKIAAYLVAGLVGLPLGADLLVDNAVEIASAFGMSDAAIGLTLVAAGTSLPEVATSLMAAIRRQSDVVLGNVIGSNLFNLLAIMGITALVAPVPVEPEFLRKDLWVMLGAALLIVPVVLFGAHLNRLWGVGLSVLYAGYIWAVLAF